MKGHLKSSFLASMLILVSLALAACGGGGGGDPTPGPGPGDSEGTATGPIRLNLDQTHAGKVGLSPSYYYFTTTTTGSYIISLSGTASMLADTLYSDSAYSAVVASCSINIFGSTGTCTVNLEGGRNYYLNVANLEFDAATFNVLISKGIGEGAKTSPVQLTVGQAHAGGVDAKGNSYYVFTANGDGSFAVSVAGATAATGITIYSGSNFTGSLKSCPSAPNPSCAAYNLVQGTPYYVQVTGSNTAGTTYNITVAAGISEGSTTNPVQLVVGDPPISGGVEAAASSYYKFTTSGAGSYLLTANNTSGIYVTLYSDAGFVSYLDYCYATTNACTFVGLDSAATYYVEVENIGGTDVTYDISVAGGQGEGSAGEPVALIINTPHTSGIDYYGSSYFTFMPDFSGNYNIDLTEMPGEMEWYLYNSPDFSSSLVQSCADWWGGDTEMRCKAMGLEAGVPYYLRVDSIGVSGIYNATVAHELNEGSAAAPVALSVGTTHAGSMDDYGESYYTFITGAAGDYAVIVNSPEAFWVDIYSDSSFSTWEASCYPNPKTICNLTGLAASTQYYVLAYQMSSVGDVHFDISVISLAVSAGCSPLAASCYGFEGGVIAPFVHTGGNTADWGIDGTQRATGTNSLKSGSIAEGSSGESCIEYTGDMWLVSFSAYVDTVWISTFDVYVDGSLRNTFDGTIPWTRIIYEVGPGTHTIKWCLHKEGTKFFDYPGTAWIDDVEFQ